MLPLEDRECERAFTEEAFLPLYATTVEVWGRGNLSSSQTSMKTNITCHLSDSGSSVSCCFVDGGSLQMHSPAKDAVTVQLEERLYIVG